MGISLIEEGLKFLVLGMTTVYLFLYLMVLILKIESKVIKNFFPEKKKKLTTIKNPIVENSDNEDEIVAVITAAIIEHRKKQG